MADVTWLIAFTAGLITFFSPCVLPLIPGYISFITGISIDDLQSQGNRKELVFKAGINSLFFVLGFSAIFIALGASATSLGVFLLKRMQIFSKLAGIIIILFGLHMAHLLPIKFLYYEKRIQMNKKPLGLLGSLLGGMAFGFGWTPCIGPSLASILAYASVQETVHQGIWLLSSYSLGLGLPFILTALSINTFIATFNKVKKHLGLVEKLGGILLIIIGLLILTGNFTVINTYLQLYLGI
ncbi:MAG: cytochrome c biogenesis protein CcdA [Candidatus Schekmanbacteria bacterium]|nr:cytochrome c biogenesis protein CcdA [Candidatus Schekmanbacteria bacterium]